MTTVLAKIYKVRSLATKMLSTPNLTECIINPFKKQEKKLKFMIFKETSSDKLSGHVQEK